MTPITEDDAHDGHGRQDLRQGIPTLVPRKRRIFGRVAHTTYLSAAGPKCTLAGLGGARRSTVTTLDELYAVAVGVPDEEDPGPAAHGVGLALEVYAAGLFEPFARASRSSTAKAT